MRARLGPLVLALVALAGEAMAQPAMVDIGYLALLPPRTTPLTLLDPPIADEGTQGARLALADNQTTGRFTNQEYALHEAVRPDEAGVLAAAGEMLAAGRRMVVLDVPAALLGKVLALPGAEGALFLNANAADDSLRGPACSARMLHLAPSHAMLADALMQFLAVKRWRNVLLVPGPAEADRAYAEALRRSARKFQLRIVADKPWTFVPGAQRTDTGHVSIAAEVARFTQGLSYDVMVVADTANQFGDDLQYRSVEPRPVAGTHGLVAAAWARPFEQWGATQLQLRFQKAARRPMTPKDYSAWMAVRAIGEAATRSRSNDAAAIAAYLRSPRFELAAFKGSRLSFRTWDGQLRQPLLLADTRSLVSVSPQLGYLHQSSELDTLGIDQPETQCRM